MVRIFIVERILKPLNNHRLLGSSYRGCFGDGKRAYVVTGTPHPTHPPKNWLFFFLKQGTQITEGQYLWQATEFNVLSKWDLGLNGPSYALKAMRSAHHFGPNKGYHHVVAFLTIVHRNPLIKWALCRTSYKRACYTIVGSNNNTRRGQLSKRSQSHRGGVRAGGGWGWGWEGLQQKAPGPVWQNVASAERGGMAGKRRSQWKGRQKRNPLPRGSWAWPSEAKRQGKTPSTTTRPLSRCTSWTLGCSAFLYFSFQRQLKRFSRVQTSCMCISVTQASGQRLWLGEVNWACTRHRRSSALLRRKLCWINILMQEKESPLWKKVCKTTGHAELRAFFFSFCTPIFSPSRSTIGERDLWFCLGFSLLLSGFGWVVKKCKELQGLKKKKKCI